MVRYNLIYDNGLESGQVVAGTLLSSGTGNRAYGNLVWSTLNKSNLIGINIYTNCSNCMVYNNTVVGFRYFGITTHEGLGSTSAIVRNNIAYQNGTNLEASGPGTIADHNLVTNPSFIDGANADFGLQQGSPAINSGTASISTGTTVVYNGSAPDIGGVESPW